MEKVYELINRQIKRRNGCNSCILDKNRKLLVESKEVVDRRKHYLEELYKDSAKLNELESEDNVPYDQLGPSIIETEYLKAMKDLKANKAPVCDEITSEMIQSLHEETHKYIFDLISEMYEMGKILEDFKKSIIIPIPKKLGTLKCEEYSILSLLSHTSKILTRIIYNRISNRIEQNLDEDQFGFRHNRGAREAILVLRRIVYKMMDKKRTLLL